MPGFCTPESDPLLVVLLCSSVFVPVLESSGIFCPVEEFPKSFPESFQFWPPPGASFRTFRKYNRTCKFITFDYNCTFNSMLSVLSVASVICISLSALVSKFVYPAISVLRGLRYGTGSVGLWRIWKHTRRWSAKDGSFDTCHPSIRLTAACDAKVMSMIV